MAPKTTSKPATKANQKAASKPGAKSAKASASAAKAKPAGKAAPKAAAAKAAAKPKPKAKAADKKDKAAADKPKAKATKAAAAKPKATKAAAAKPKAAKKEKKEKTPVSEPESEAESEAAPAAEDKPKANGSSPEPKRKAERAPAPPKAPAPIKRRKITNRLNELPLPASEGKQVFVWGTGDMGQFGLGPDELDEKPRPQLHKWFQEQAEEGELGSPGGIETIAAGGMHTLAIDQKGQVRSWGINDNAALGRNTAKIPDPENAGGFLPADEYETWPFVIEALVKENFRAVKVAAGDSVSVAVSDKGDVRAWGSFRSNEGLLGFDGVPGNSPFQFTPIELPALARVEVVDVACGADHVLALTSEGHVYVWGNGQQNQLGRRVMARRQLNGLEPERLGLRNIVHVAAGMFHSFAVDKDGIVYAWGLNTFRQTGIADEDDDMVIRPTIVDALSPALHNGSKVTQVAAGEHYSLFLFDNGEVYGCGRCDANELGLASDNPAQEGIKERRAEEKARKEKKVVDAQAALDKIKAADNADEEDIEEAQASLAEAQAGVNIPGDDMVPEPVRIAFPPIPESYEVVPELGAWSDEPTVNPIAQLAAGTRHNLAVSRSGHLYSWGLGNGAQLGLGSEEEAETPTLVRSKQLRPYDSVAPSAGGQHCVLLARIRAD